MHIQTLAQLAKANCSHESSRPSPDFRRLLAHANLGYAVEEALLKERQQRTLPSLSQLQPGSHVSRGSNLPQSIQEEKPSVSEREVEDDEDDDNDVEEDIDFEDYELAPLVRGKKVPRWVGLVLGDDDKLLDEDDDDMSSEDYDDEEEEEEEQDGEDGEDDADDDYDDEDVDIFGKLRMVYNSQHPITHEAQLQRIQHIQATAVATVQQALQTPPENTQPMQGVEAAAVAVIQQALQAPVENEQPLQTSCMPISGLDNVLPTPIQAVVPV